uniref:Uncharacterized protein n=1 Tax=Rhizophora mucronata TaxID=61149 RepID=A0A2P2R2F9_RHIMU
MVIPLLKKKKNHPEVFWILKLLFILCILP